MELCIKEHGLEHDENSSMCTSGEEVRRAIQDLRFGRTTGRDGLTLSLEGVCAAS